MVVDSMLPGTLLRTIAQDAVRMPPLAHGMSRLLGGGTGGGNTRKHCIGFSFPSFFSEGATWGLASDSSMGSASTRSAFEAKMSF